MERELRQELDAAATRLATFERAFVELSATNQDYQKTTNKLSARIKELQDRISELEEMTGEQQQQSVEKAKETKMILEKNVKLASTADKARSNAIELELRKIENTQFKEHIESVPMQKKKKKRKKEKKRKKKQGGELRTLCVCI